MAKFLNTSATNFFLEELIKNAKERLILISPYLRLNDHIKELLEDKDRLKIDVRIVYSKSDLHPEEIKWIQKLDYVRLSFCKNLHTKCYLNESECIISSLNLYEFSQVNNNEMGISVRKYEDDEVFKDAYEEAQRIIRISEEVRISLDEVKNDSSSKEIEIDEESNTLSKLTTSKLAAKHKIKTADFLDKMTEKGFLKLNENGRHLLTEQGKEIDGEFRPSQYGGYFLWNENTEI